MELCTRAAASCWRLNALRSALWIGNESRTSTAADRINRACDPSVAADVCFDRARRVFAQLRRRARTKRFTEQEVWRVSGRWSKHGDGPGLNRPWARDCNAL